MKIDNIDIFSYYPDIITPRFIANLSMKDYKGVKSYKLRAITGLDAEEISSKFYGYTYMSSRKSYTMSAGKRFVTIQVELNPNYAAGETISDLRDNLYRGISSSRTGDIVIVFKRDTERIALLRGSFKKFEYDHFSDSTVVTMTIACPDSMLKSDNEIEIDVSEFSLENFSILDNTSTAPHGFRFCITCTGPSNLFSITEPITLDWKFEVVPNFITPEHRGFIVGDQLIFSSIPGSRQLQVLRDGEYYHIVDKLAPGSFWPMVFPGLNEFNVDGTNFEWSWMRHYYTYWGI